MGRLCRSLQCATVPLAAALLLGATTRDPGAAAPPASGTSPLDEHAGEVLALQVALDRARFSPGEIDGRAGALTASALAAFRSARGLPSAVSPLDEATKAALGDAFAQPLTRYTITEQDAAGPFVPDIPSDLMAQAELETLGYTSLLELLGERFHSSPSLLARLNPGVTFEAGTSIAVPAVEPMELASREGRRAHDGKTPAPAPAAEIELTEAIGAVIARDDRGTVLLHVPATVGSVQDPLPVGDWKIVGVHDRPVFNYNPDLFWDADPSHAKARIAAGPNNPVGLVWIDIDKEHFGFHGTPEPSQIGRTTSHGCVRLTNWDALRLADLVAEGTPVRLR